MTPIYSLIIGNQQFVDKLPLGGYRADASVDVHASDLVMSVQVIEEGVLRVLLSRIGIREHSLHAHRVELLAEPGQSYLLRIVEPVRHVGCTAA